MLLNGHDLNVIVAVPGYAGQNIVFEFGVGAHLFGILRHADVALVDEQGILLGTELGLFPDVGFLWGPYLSREYLGLLVLHHALGPGRNALAFSPIPLDMNLVKIAVFHGFGG